MISKNPNASVVAVAAGLAALTAWLLGHFGVPLSAELGVTIAGVYAAAILYVGRNGAVGTWNKVKQLVLHGSQG